MSQNKVYILFDAIRTGKTTALQEWAKKANNISGFLSPDVDGKRMFLDIETYDLIPMQTENQDLIVGKFAFDSNSFLKVENKILKAWEDAIAEIIILDEIGPLEINRSLGFHRLLTRLQEKTTSIKPILFFVVRDYCLETFKKKYDFDITQMMTLQQFKDEFIT